jgi:hypothetical protein
VAVSHRRDGLRPGHPGHRDVDQHDFGQRPGGQHAQSVAAVFGLSDGEPGLLQDQPTDVAQILAVIDDEHQAADQLGDAGRRDRWHQVVDGERLHEPRGGVGRAVADRLTPGGCLRIFERRGREPDRERRPRPGLTGDANHPVVFLHDTEDHRQPEPMAAPRLGGEVGLEDAINGLRRHPRAIVCRLDRDVPQLADRKLGRRRA